MYGVHLFILAIFGRQKMMMMMGSEQKLVLRLNLFRASGQAILGTLKKNRARACAGGRGYHLARGTILTSLGMSSLSVFSIGVWMPRDPTRTGN